jgi:serine/threonine-protein kinase
VVLEPEAKGTSQKGSGSISALLTELARGPEEGLGGGWDRWLQPGVVVGRFELVREVGRGGFGVVWEARDRELGRAVAFKAVRAGNRAAMREELLLHEAEAAARLSHPNIVTLHDLGRSEHGPYLVLELLRGQTLAERVAQGPVPAREALRIATEIAKGLAHAHAAGVVHRDLKPANVILCHDGQVKVLDFGLAHAFGRRAVSGGTPGYMAPEQREGAPEDERTDVFALGVMLHRMLSGALPFPDDSGKTRTAPQPAPLLDVPDAPELGPLVARMLATNPADRPRNGAEVLEELTRIGDRLAYQFAERGAAPAKGPSIAVLPLVNLSGDKEQEYFSDGLTEELLNLLARVPGLHVAARTSSFAFKGKNEDIAAIAQKLHVKTVLEGSLRKAGDQIRITTQLINAADGFHLWSETYERKLTDVFAVQDEIAKAVVEALKLKLLELPTSKARRTANPDAYNEYLLARQLFRRQNVDGYIRAAHAYEKALQLDTDYAPAWAGLAEASFWVADAGESAADLDKGYSKALEAADRAIALGPDLADGYLIRAFLRATIQWDWVGAGADLEKARLLKPEDADILYVSASAQLRPMGRMPEAIAAMRKACELDPLNARYWGYLGMTLLLAGDFAAARTALTRSLEISPEQVLPPMNLANSYLLEGKPARALELSQRSTAPYARLLAAAMAEHDLGHAARSRQLLDETIAKYAHIVAYQIGEVYAWRGEIDRAFEWLDKAAAYRDGGLMLVKTSPFLRNLRGDPRYAELLRKMNLPPDSPHDGEEVRERPRIGGPVRTPRALVMTGIGLFAAAAGLVGYFALRGGPGVPVGGPSIAVLPLVDLSANKDQEYFSDGLTEELLNLLAKTPGLRVAARTSSFAFKGKNEDVASIAQKLHVKTVLEGSVRKAGDQIRITTQLINAADGYHLWSETYERKLTDVFAVQDEIAKAVAGALKLKLLDAPTSDERRTVNPSAYNDYLLARQFFHRNNRDGFVRAVQLYEKALALDPDYAPAWAGLSVAVFWVADSAESSAAIEAGYQRAVAAAGKAVALGGDLPDGYVARGLLRIPTAWDFEGSGADLRRALALKPDDSDALSTYADVVLRAQGHLKEAIAALRKASEVDPLNARVWTLLGSTLIYDGQLDTARQALNRSVEISPEQAGAAFYLGETLLLEGRATEAMAIMHRPGNPVYQLLGIAVGEHDLGHPAESQRALDALIAGHSHDGAYQIAEAYAWRGDKDRAFEWLERARVQHDGGLHVVKVDPLLTKLRRDPRYAALLRKINLPVD